MKKLFTALIYFGLVTSIQTQAAQHADLICVKSIAPQTCEEYELRVTIQTEKLAGQKGLYGIYAMTNHKDPQSVHSAYWTESTLWSAYSEQDLLQPVFPTLKPLEPERQFVIFRGTKNDLCNTLSNGNDLSIYAWYASLSNEDYRTLKNFFRTFDISGFKARNFRNMYLMALATKYNTGGLVYSFTCIKQQSE